MPDAGVPDPTPITDPADPFACCVGGRCSRPFETPPLEVALKGLWRVIDSRLRNGPRETGRALDGPIVSITGGASDVRAFTRGSTP